MAIVSPKRLSAKHFFADLHIHSRFSRATARTLAPETLAVSAAAKGLDLVGTGDLTHPEWLNELDAKLETAAGGFYRLKREVLDTALSRPAGAGGARGPVLDPGGPPGGVRGIRGLSASGRAGSTLFTPTGEISCIYKQGGRTRKIHLVVWCPTLDGARKVSVRLGGLGNVRSDGRPILGLSARDATAAVLDADPDARVIPAHVWTPWFSLFGSMSGFDDPDECFGDLSGEITALETGLSSDPWMNRLVSRLDRYALVSSSDAHSPDKLGREATAISGPPDVRALRSAILGGPELLGTVEFFPEEGKYHLDGHSSCGPAMTPEETGKLKGICPVCGKPLTVGVLNRVMELADRRSPPDGSLKPDWHILPLREIIGQCLGRGPDTVGVRDAEAKLLNAFGSEYRILLETPASDLALAAGELMGLAVTRMREGKVTAKGGYDGVFGTVEAVSEEDRREAGGSGTLFGTVPRGRRPIRRNPEPRTSVPAPGTPEVAPGPAGGKPAGRPPGGAGKDGGPSVHGRGDRGGDIGRPPVSGGAEVRTALPVREDIFPDRPPLLPGFAPSAHDAGARAAHDAGARTAHEAGARAGYGAPHGPDEMPGGESPPLILCLPLFPDGGDGPVPPLEIRPNHTMRPLFATDSGPEPAPGPERGQLRQTRRPRPAHPFQPPLPRPSSRAFGTVQPPERETRLFKPLAGADSASGSSGSVLSPPASSGQGAGLGPPGGTAVGSGYLDGLNEAQLSCATFGGNSLLVAAGPGSGKTRVLLARALWLLDRGLAGPDGMLLTTFTRKAAQTLSERLAQASGAGEAPRVGTLHSLALDMLRRGGIDPRLAPEEAREEMAAEAAKGCGISAKNLLAFVSRAKNLEIPLDAPVPGGPAGSGSAGSRLNPSGPAFSGSSACSGSAAYSGSPGATGAPGSSAGPGCSRTAGGPEGAEGQGAAMAAIRYGDAMKSAGFMDFDDLITEALALDAAGFRSGFRAVLADEAQDLSPLEYRFLEALAREASLTAIGDPAQSIYGFRGALPSLSAALMRGRPDLAVASLKLNYRCTPVISAASELFRVQDGTERFSAVPGRGRRIVRAQLDSPLTEAIYIARSIKEHLGGLLPGGSARSGGDALDGLTLGDVAVIYRLRVQGQELLKTLLDEGLPCQISGDDGEGAQDGLDLKAEKVSLLTIHAAKGLEFRLVFVAGLDEGLFPYAPPSDGAPGYGRAEEEERLFYVALTRARELVYLTRVRRRRIHGRMLSGRPSPFWDRIPAEAARDVTARTVLAPRPAPLF
ncbi:MAG: UvrD-helicase domain-containing protein [Deltaproteobacteria bacterium]|jgi:uncharacterized protein (TIGR00375 family)|nr:UvrD-helicase domain-containing protein [Deltaproteobacteria bacterium]